MKHKIFIFLICLAISFALWYLVGDSHKETVRFSLSAKVSESPTGHISTDPSQKKIDFQIFTLRNDVEKIEKKDKITFDLYFELRSPDTIAFFLDTAPQDHIIIGQ